MERRWYDERDPKISDIKVRINEGRVLLQFMWPNELELVYIYRCNLQRGETIDYDKPYRRYTKNEYASFGGFMDEAAEGGIMKYVICPYIEDDFESYVVCFEDGSNEAQVIASKVEIKYEITEKKKLFSSRKLVKMHIFCEADMPKGYLRYVKKKGSIPVSLSDGMCFEFIDDFWAGDNDLPEIEVDKDEFVRIYLSDEVPYKEAYRVIKG